MLTHWDVKAPRVGVMARIPSTMAMTVPSSAFEGLGKCAAIPVTKLAALERMLALILRHLNAAKLAAPIMVASKVITPASTNLILDPGPDRPGAARQRSLLSSLFISAVALRLGGGSRLA
jgi:hypothetical protein